MTVQGEHTSGGVEGSGPRAVEAARPAGERASIGAVIAAVFGPRPRESALWGVALGFVFGLPLVLSYFMLQFYLTEIVFAWTLGRAPEFDVDDTARLITVTAAVLLVTSVIGIVGLGVVIARVRRACTATILLCAYVVSVIPYSVFYVAFVLAP